MIPDFFFSKKFAVLVVVFFIWLLFYRYAKRKVSEEIYGVDEYGNKIPPRRKK